MANVPKELDKYLCEVVLSYCLRALWLPQTLRLHTSLAHSVLFREVTVKQNQTGDPNDSVSIL